VLRDPGSQDLEERSVADLLPKRLQCDRSSAVNRARDSTPGAKGLGEGEAAPVEGRNDFGPSGYQGAPTSGDLAEATGLRSGWGASIGTRSSLRRYGHMAEAKQGVERHVEAFNAHQADAELWTEDAEFAAPGASMRGREDVLAFLGAFWEAFPDGRLELSQVFREGSVTAAEGRFIGTHSRVFRTPTAEVPASGRVVDFRWMSAYEARGDEFAWEHLYFDQVEFLTQLGLM
jgi:predicted ester cyclase